MKTLMSEVTYSNQANALFGRRKTIKLATRKSVTVCSTRVSLPLMSLEDWGRNQNSLLTRSSQWKAIAAPKLYQDVEETCFGPDDGDPSCSG